MKILNLAIRYILQQITDSQNKDAPKVRAPGEYEAMEVIGGSHGVQNDVGEHAVVKPFQLNMIAQRREVAIQRGPAHLATAAPLPGAAVVGILRMRVLLRHLHRSAALAAVATVVVSLDGEMLRLRCQ